LLVLLLLLELGKLPDAIFYSCNLTSVTLQEAGHDSSLA
jgi:hypothetical protein